MHVKIPDELLGLPYKYYRFSISKNRQPQMIYEEQCNSENTLHRRAMGENAFSMNNLMHHVEK